MGIQKILHYKYDPGATETYAFYGDQSELLGGVTTAGSSTTTTAVAGTPFNQIAVGDIIRASKGNVTSGGVSVDNFFVRLVTAKASETSLTVNSAWDLSATGGYAGSMQKLEQGTAATSGWFWTGGLSSKHVKINVETLAATNIIMSIEGKYEDPDATGVDIVPEQTYTAAGSDDVTITEDWPFMRVGLRHTGAGTDIVSVYFEAASDNVVAL